jgi:DnaJ family protein A protein 2
LYCSKGGKQVKQCGGCNGSGTKLNVRQVGPGMYTQVNGPCGACSGTGEFVADKDKCKKCKGKKTIPKKKTVEFNIEKGMRDGTRIVLSKEADQVPGLPPGDLILVLDLQEHETFTNTGDSLEMDMEISLSEALCGILNIVTLYFEFDFKYAYCCHLF